MTTPELLGIATSISVLAFTSPSTACAGTPVAPTSPRCAPAAGVPSRQGEATVEAPAIAAVASPSMRSRQAVPAPLAAADIWRPLSVEVGEPLPAAAAGPSPARTLASPGGTTLMQANSSFISGATIPDQCSAPEARPPARDTFVRGRSGAGPALAPAPAPAPTTATAASAPAEAPRVAPPGLLQLILSWSPTCKMSSPSPLPPVSRSAVPVSDATRASPPSPA